MNKKLLSTIVIIVTTIFLLIGNSNNLFDLNNNINSFISKKSPEDELIKLSTGISQKYVESIFGIPLIENTDDKLSQYIYSFDQFYLQVIFDDQESVKFYAVTSKSKDFTPEIPFLGSALGSRTFSKISEDYEFIYSNLSSKYYEYAESHYFGNPGNYRTYYLVYSPSGFDFNNDIKKVYSISEDEYLQNKSKIDELRNWLIPNTYAVGDILGDETQILSSYTIGINYFVTRDL